MVLLEDLSILENIEIYIFIFFLYSFAGWFMESVGGILNVKKFINRGFLIGPYCPVYGCGVVLITLLLNKYKSDIGLVFILSILICGTLEYFTSYFMEKLFNARWWDYHNRKFNINGRICLETLLPFGFGGTIILCFLNPIFIDLFIKIPYIVRNILTGLFVVIYIVDCIISFIIILSFKGETYKERDNTEEISKMVKDKTEDIIMQAESSAIVFGRKIKLSNLKFERKVKYTRKKLSDAINSQITQTKAEFEAKQKETKELFDNTIRKRINDLEEMQKKSKEKAYNTLQNLKNTSEEFTKQVRNSFMKGSILRKRLMEAFPKLEVIPKTKKEKKKK